jgi:hypothetical protein
MNLLVQFKKSSDEEKEARIVRMQVISGLPGLRGYVSGHEAESYRIEVTYHDQRSLPQNARFHALVAEYGKAVGYTLDEAKALLKHQYGIMIPFIEGFIPPDRPGRFVKLYGEVEFQISTADYSKDEMSRLMEGVEMALSGV